MSFAQKWYREFLSDKAHYIFLFLILAVGAGLRIYFLSQPPNYDESFSFYYYALRPLSAGLSDYTYPNNHLFHTFLSHVAYLIGGSSIIILRMPAFIAGILLIASIYIFARLLSNKQIALMAAVLVATSSYLIEYSTNARGYSIISLFFIWLLIIVYFIKYGNEKRQLRYLALFIIFSVLGFYTIPTMFYPFMIALVWLGKDLLISPRTFIKSRLFNRSLISLFLIFAFSLILYLPVLLRSGINAVTGNKFVEPQSFQKLISGWPQMLQNIWGGWSDNWIEPLGILIFSGVLIFYIFIFYTILYKKNAAAYWRDLGFLALITPSLLFLLLLLQRVVPPPRVFIFAFSLFVIFAAAGLNYFLKFIFDKYNVKGGIISLINYGLISIFLIVPAVYLFAGGERLLFTEETAIEDRIDIQPIISTLQLMAAPDEDIILIEGYHPGYQYYAYQYKLTVPMGFDPAYPLQAGIDLTKRYLFVFHYNQFRKTLGVFKKIESEFAGMQKTELNISCTKQLTQVKHSYILALQCR